MFLSNVEYRFVITGPRQLLITTLFWLSQCSPSSIPHPRSPRSALPRTPTATGDEPHFPGEETEATAETTTLTTSEETEPELAESQNVMCNCYCQVYCQVKSSTPSHLTSDHPTEGGNKLSTLLSLSQRILT